MTKIDNRRKYRDTRSAVLNLVKAIAKMEHSEELRHKAVIAKLDALGAAIDQNRPQKVPTVYEPSINDPVESVEAEAYRKHHEMLMEQMLKSVFG